MRERLTKAVEFSKGVDYATIMIALGLSTINPALVPIATEMIGLSLVTLGGAEFISSKIE